jgi:hypothetical protein
MSPHKRRRRFIDGFLDQETTPACTAASVLTTVGIWIVVALDLVRTGDWGSFGLLITALFFGSLLNVVLGSVAAARGEYCGGRIAALGILLWYLTVLTFYVARGGRLWG